MIGKNYEDVWHCKTRYMLLYGGRASKKSTNVAIMLIYRMMKFEGASVLVVRNTYRSLRDSCFNQLNTAVGKMGVRQFWKSTVNPLEMTYTPTGAKIHFIGMNDPDSVTSINAGTYLSKDGNEYPGYIAWTWFEEAYQLESQEEFQKVVDSIRGEMPPHKGLFRQFILTMNPWKLCWIKERFCDTPDPMVSVFKKTYKDNEFLEPEYIADLEKTRERNPRLAKVTLDGEWGAAESAIYTNWDINTFNYEEIATRPNVRPFFGLDFGYAISYNAFIAVLADPIEREMWIFDEMYQKGMTNLDIAKRITEMGYAKEKIVADSAEPKSIYELRQGLIEEVPVSDSPGAMKLYRTYSLPNITSAVKGADSVNNGISRIQEYHINVHPNCENTILELTNYSWELDNAGVPTGKPEKDFDHLMDALRYALNTLLIRGHTKVIEASGGSKPTEHAIEAPKEVQDAIKREKRCRVVSTVG